eukprot:scaffold61765_cov60-Phaeocystis_antarctica.AAC.5
MACPHRPPTSSMEHIHIQYHGAPELQKGRLAAPTVYSSASTGAALGFPCRPCPRPSSPPWPPCSAASSW